MNIRDRILEKEAIIQIASDRLYEKGFLLKNIQMEMEEIRGLILNEGRELAELKLEENWISLKDLRDGQIAIIRKWSAFPQYIGRVIQRSGDDLITLRGDFGSKWTGFYYYNKKSNWGDYLVEVVDIYINTDGNFKKVGGKLE